MTQKYGADNEGSNAPRDYGKPGWYASLDEMAGRKPAYQDGPIRILRLIREVLDEHTAASSADVKVVGKEVVIRPGHAVMTTLLDVDGVEYELFMRQAD